MDGINLSLCAAALAAVITALAVMPAYTQIAKTEKPPHEPPVPAAGSSLIKTFENPPAFYRGKPFWSWNGKLDKTELLRQAKILKAMGFGGYFMHSRVGLATEYLGEEWFSLINDMSDESQKLGMQAFLYDEDRWPSGSAGGLAALKESNRMKFLRLRILKPSEFKWDDSLVAAFACKLDGINFSSCRRLDKSSSEKAGEGESVLAFSIDVMQPHPFYNGSAYIDTMDPAAVADFISLTHEQYCKRCGARIGTSIQGIFTDEPHRGMLMSSFGQGPADPEHSIPWTPKLPELFKARFGIDLIDSLPDIFLRREGARISPVKWQYVEEIQTLFLQNYMKPIQDWCRANSMVFTGHVLHEDNLVAQVVPNGSMLRNYEYMDAPGMDQLAEGNRWYWNPVQVASVAHQLGKRQVLSELYGCTGWQMSFKNYRDVGGWQALLGVNLRCPHLSWYTMKGECKRDYPASISCQSSWWPEWKNIESYFARLNVILERGKPDRSLLVLDPIESVWAQIGLGWCNGLSAGTAEIGRLESTYQELFRWLQDSAVDFDYGNEDIIHRYGKVIAGPEPELQIGQARYRAVLVAGMETIRGTTLDLLERFVKAGGKVVAAGEIPAYVDASLSSRASNLAKNWINTPLDRKSCVDACRSAIGREAIRLIERAGTDPQEVYCQVRREGDATWFAVMNMNRTDARPGLVARLRGKGAVEEWNLLTGERQQVKVRTGESGWVEIDSDLATGETRIFRLVKKSSLPYAPKLVDAEHIPAPGPYAYKLEEPNVCLLDRARWRVDKGEWQDENEVLRIDQSLRDRFGIPQRGGEMVQPWYAAKYLPAPKEVCELEMAFDFYADEVPAAPVEVAMEDINRWEVSLNGVKLDPKTSPGFWIDIAFKRLLIPAGALKKGLNTVTLAAKFRSDLDIETLYLTGGFGVRIDGKKRTLVRLPKKLKAGSVVEQGLPFYGAGIAYQIPVPEKCRNGGQVTISTPKFEAACIMAGGINEPKRMIAWEPYRASVGDLCKNKSTLLLKVVLTRRNTFGPVHEYPVRTWAYHPGSFRSAGDGWRDEYVLLPNGLLEAPEFMLQRPESERKAVAGNPIVPNIGLTDPHAVIFGDRAWIYATHDESAKNAGFAMNDWWAWSSPDLVNWKQESVLKPEQTFIGRPFRDCWATFCVAKNGKYYWYFSAGPTEIGVVVSDSPAGPWKDPLGKPLIPKGLTPTEQRDPDILIDDDGKAYMVFGTFDYYIVRLGDNMVSLAEKPRPVVLDRRYGPYGEGKTDDKPSLHKRNGIYYLSWSSFYATADNVYGPYTYKGTVIDPGLVAPDFRGQDLFHDRHGNFFTWNNQWYYTCNDKSQPGRSDYFRDAIISYVHYKDNGEIAPIRIDRTGVGQYDANQPKIEAEDYFELEGGKVRECPSGFEVRGLHEGSRLIYPNVANLPANATLRLSYACGNPKGATIEIRDTNVQGKVLGRCRLLSTAGLTSYRTVACRLANKAGRASLCLTFKGAGDELLRLDWLSFK